MYQCIKSILLVGIFDIFNLLEEICRKMKDKASIEPILDLGKSNLTNLIYV